MSYEDWRKQNASIVRSIVQNTMEEGLDRTKGHLTQLQDCRESSSNITPAGNMTFDSETLLPVDDSLMPIDGPQNGAPYQMLYDAAVDVGIASAKGLIDLVKVGVSSFFHIMETHPTYFDTFLKRTEEYFDAYIRAYCADENVRFIGGKLNIDLASEETLALTAEFYFFTPEKTWTVHRKEGSLKIDAIIDWEHNPDMAELRGEGHLEYPLEPPSDPQY